MLLRTTLQLIFLITVNISSTALCKSPSCVSCHKDLKSGSTVHGPVKANGCNICHSARLGEPAHLKDHPPVVTLRGQQTQATCLICHDQMKGSIHHDASHVHQPVREKGCLECHNPHHSEHRKLLKKPATQLCLDCHQAMAHLPGTQHAALNKEKNCLNCHQPHASREPALLKEGERGVCLRCHDSMKKRLASHPVHHPPIDENRCTACHQPHASSERALLKASYTDKVYVPFEGSAYQLCFKCHNSSLATQERSTTVTRFRNGSTNLHYLHLQLKKGRSCQACHEVHASARPHLLRDWSPSFGGVQVPLQYVVDKEGGNCTTSCHQLRSYNRVKEVRNDQGR